MSKRFVAVAVLFVLAVGMLLPTIAQAKTPSVIVSVTDEQGLPLTGAQVSLWNHSASPSELAGTSVTDMLGMATFDLPKMKGPKEVLSQHLAVSVIAQGFEHFVTDWSVERRQAKKQGNGDVLLAEVQPSDFELSAKLRRTPPSDNLETAAMQVLRTDIGETRERLVWSDNYYGQLAKVATLHQVGDMQTGFKYGTTLFNKQSVGIKYEGDDEFSLGAAIEVSEYTGVVLSWDLNATGNDAAYKYRDCKTYFDYRAEEYYIEEFKDRGDGLLDWVKVDSFIKTWCDGVASNPTSAGTGILSTTAPSSSLSWRDYAPTSGSEWANTTHESIGSAVTLSISGINVSLNLYHDTSTSEQWKFYNTSTLKFYQGAPAGNGVWRLRLKP